MYRLIGKKDFDNEMYKLSDEQRIAVEESQSQYKTGQFLTDKQVNKKIDEWLSK